MEGSAVRRSLHGRRHGRRLRAGRQALVDRLLPDLGIELPPPGERLDLSAVFGYRPAAVWLEIGFGAGEHLAWQAERHPRVAFIGAEYFVNGIASLLRLIDERGLTNIRLWQGDGRDLIDALPPASITRAFALFSDPWPKARHRKRRLIRRQTLDGLARALTEGADLRVATDHADYLQWILERATAHGDLAWQARGPEDWRRRPADWPATRYELKAIDEGRRPAYLSFVRRRRQDAL